MEQQLVLLRLLHHHPLSAPGSLLLLRCHRFFVLLLLGSPRLILFSGSLLFGGGDLLRLGGGGSCSRGCSRRGRRRHLSLLLLSSLGDDGFPCFGGVGAALRKIVEGVVRDAADDVGRRRQKRPLPRLFGRRPRSLGGGRRAIVNHFALWPEATGSQLQVVNRVEPAPDGGLVAVREHDAHGRFPLFGLAAPCVRLEPGGLHETGGMRRAGALWAEAAHHRLADDEFAALLLERREHNLGAAIRDGHHLVLGLLHLLLHRRELTINLVIRELLRLGALGILRVGVARAEPRLILRHVLRERQRHAAPLGATIALDPGVGRQAGRRSVRALLSRHRLWQRREALLRRVEVDPSQHRLEEIQPLFHRLAALILESNQVLTPVLPLAPVVVDESPDTQRRLRRQELAVRRLHVQGVAGDERVVVEVHRLEKRVARSAAQNGTLLGSRRRWLGLVRDEHHLSLDPVPDRGVHPANGVVGDEHRVEVGIDKGALGRLRLALRALLRRFLLLAFAVASALAVVLLRRLFLRHQRNSSVLEPIHEARLAGVLVLLLLRLVGRLDRWNGHQRRQERNRLELLLGGNDHIEPVGHLCANLPLFAVPETAVRLKLAWLKGNRRSSLGMSCGAR
mmetsp:Transcript_9993/g.32757  ORF Transcript_9993/g.32757 Transcript_9993/m.32757 type:complete len:623 (-) Transcript_9993:3012-4880(-)